MQDHTNIDPNNQAFRHHDPKARHLTRLYMVHDSALNQYIMPHVARSPGEAERDFRTGASDPKNGHVFHNTEQFNLYECAAIDPHTGLVTAYNAPVLILQGQQIKAAKE